jgi:hypothetical protein
LIKEEKVGYVFLAPYPIPVLSLLESFNAGPLHSFAAFLVKDLFLAS